MKSIKQIYVIPKNMKILIRYSDNSSEEIEMKDEPFLIGQCDDQMNGVSGKMFTYSTERNTSEDIYLAKGTTLSKEGEL